MYCEADTGVQESEAGLVVPPSPDFAPYDHLRADAPDDTLGPHAPEVGRPERFRLPAWRVSP